MTPVFLTIFLIVLVKTDNHSEEMEIVEDERGVDERAEGLMARLEALRDIEEEVVDYEEESRGGLGEKVLQQEALLNSEVPNSSKGNVKAGGKEGEWCQGASCQANCNQGLSRGQSGKLNLRQENRGNERNTEWSQGAACQTDCNQGAKQRIWSPGNKSGQPQLDPQRRTDGIG